MTTLALIAIGGVVAVVVLIFAVALCRASAKPDEAACEVCGRKVLVPETGNHEPWCTVEGRRLAYQAYLRRAGGSGKRSDQRIF